MYEFTKEELLIIQETLSGNISGISEFLEDEIARRHVRNIEMVLQKVSRLLKMV